VVVVGKSPAALIARPGTAGVRVALALVTRRAGKTGLPRASVHVKNPLGGVIAVFIAAGLLELLVK
jgi:uncharacterized membrane protein SpoIIM required for sporulation